MPQSKRSSHTGVLLLAVLLGGCAKDTIPPENILGATNRLAALANGVTRAESLAILGTAMSSATIESSGDPEQCVMTASIADYVSCSIPVPTVVPNPPWLQHSGGIYEPEQRAPIEITFAGRVRGMTLMSSGALSCTGTYGTMIGYRSGAEVTRADNVLVDPGDCGQDSVTHGVRGALPPDIDIDRLVIIGVDPWQFLVLNQCCGRALLRYELRFQYPTISCGNVTRGQVTSCQIQMSVNGVSGWRFAGTLDPAPAGQSDSVFVNDTSTSLEWSGRAVVSGVVSAFVTVGGVADTLTTSLTVASRNVAVERLEVDLPTGRCCTLCLF